MKVLNELKSEYEVSTSLGGLANSAFESKKKKFAYVDYEVVKGFKWNMKIYADEAKKELLIEAEEQSALAGFMDQAGYVFKDAKTGDILGAWVPKKRILNIFLKAPYKLVVNNNVLATAPGEGFFKLFIPGSMRKFIARKVLASNGNVLAKISTRLSGGVKVKPEGPGISDDFIATAIAVLAAICGVQD